MGRLLTSGIKTGHTSPLHLAELTSGPIF
jgi:hypothetical protein